MILYEINIIIKSFQKEFLKCKDVRKFEVLSIHRFHIKSSNEKIIIEYHPPIKTNVPEVDSKGFMILSVILPLLNQNDSRRKR